jgi:ribosomal protein S18 acetylase RimI-like enzyme
LRPLSLQATLDNERELALEKLLRERLHGWRFAAGGTIALAAVRRTRRAWAGTAGASRGIESDGHIVAAGHVGRADWDSAHFGMEIGRLDDLAATDAISAAEQEEAATLLVADLLAPMAASVLVFARVSLESTPLLRALEQQGFRLYDTQSTFLSTSLPALVPMPACTLRSGVAADADELAAVCAEAMSEVPSHLHADHHLDQSKVRALYGEWARNSVVAGLADHVVVAEVGGVIAGLTSVRIEGRAEPPSARLATIPLVAVASEHRGAGIGRALVASALRWAKEHGAPATVVGTQSYNFAASHLYTSLGMRPVAAHANLHLSRAGSR